MVNAKTENEVNKCKLCGLSFEHSIALGLRGIGMINKLKPGLNLYSNICNELNQQKLEEINYQLHCPLRSGNKVCEKVLRLVRIIIHIKNGLQN